MVDDINGKPDYIPIGPVFKAAFEKVFSESKPGKRLQRAIDRIKANGGKVMVHHTPRGGEHGIMYQLLNGQRISTWVVFWLVEKGMLEPGNDGLLPGCDQTLHLVIA